MDEESRQLLELTRETRRMAKHSRIQLMTIFKLLADNLADGKVNEVIETLLNMHDYYKRDAMESE